MVSLISHPSDPARIRLQPESNAVSGLIILHADYGLETSFTDRGIKENEVEEDVIDVTIPIQALVSNSKLVIPGGRSKVGKTVLTIESLLMSGPTVQPHWLLGTYLVPGLFGSRRPSADLV
jgi:hypothetical protein